MSLVGKELEVAYAVAPGAHTDVVVSSSSIDDDEYFYKCVSPANGAESLFMAGLNTSTISAKSLATEIRKNHRPIISASTVGTDDFVSAFDNIDDIHRSSTYSLGPQPIYELDEDSKMSTAAGKINVDEIEVDAAGHVYEAAKNVWGWGKDQMIISNFLGIAEGVAGKIASMAGTDLEEIDGNLKPELSKFDSSVLNPAIKAILGVILNAAGKGEEVFKPIVVSILKPIGLLEDKKKETIAPEYTNPSAVRVS